MIVLNSEEQVDRTQRQPQSIPRKIKEEVEIERLWNTLRTSGLEIKRLLKLQTMLVRQDEQDVGKINAVEKAINNYKTRVIVSYSIRK